jgi:predicted GNAT family N-acyltransferase
MTPNPRFAVRTANWHADAAPLKSVRQAVFVNEQSVPAELEWDAHDESSVHVLAEADGLPIGTGRLLADDSIGRMAVLKAWRGRGVGSALLEALLDLARARGSRNVALNAQTTALGFYRRHGFMAEGEEFPDAGIPHFRMRCKL